MTSVDFADCVAIFEGKQKLGPRDCGNKAAVLFLEVPAEVVRIKAPGLVFLSTFPAKREQQTTLVSNRYHWNVLSSPRWHNKAFDET